MKVDKNNPIHWLLLCYSAVLIFLAIPFRVFKNHKKSVVFFYQMHGNSKALADYLSARDKSVDIYFLAFPQYLKIYDGKQNYRTLSMLKFRDMIKVARCSVLVTNYEALTLLFLAKFTSIKFVDTWHGIPMLKNQTPKILSYLNSYEEVWVSSPAMRKFYKERYQLTSKIIATGYGRVDKLVSGGYRNVKQKYNIPEKKIIMIAPTWKQNDPNRSALPFGMTEPELLSRLNALAVRTNSFIIFRAHMLSGSGVGNDDSLNVLSMPTKEYPDTEELLSIVDILVTDWSSLVFDYIVLDRPVVFIDVNAPFIGDEALKRSSPHNRFGHIVSDIDTFEQAVEEYLRTPAIYLKRYRKEIQRTKELAYGDMADGKATQRYYRRIRQLLRD